MQLEYKWQVLIIVMIGTMMGALDSSIVNVSIPNIMADFGSSVNDIEWVITAYMLAFATLMPLTAWLRDRIGHKTLYILSLGVFTVGSVLCGIAWNLPSLIVARVIQALGGGAITPTGMAMISEVFKPQERGKALGYWGVGVIVGPAIGPTLGGFLTKTLGWRSIFLVNLPIGIIGIFMAIAMLQVDKPSHAQRKPFDFWGFAFLSTFLVAFLLGLSKGEEEGWTSTYIFWCAVASIVGFAGFLLVESLEREGIMDIRLFKSKIFSACMAVTFVRSVALFGGTFLLPVFLETHMGLDEIQTGLILLPGALIIGVFMPIAGKLSDQIGPRGLTVVGLIFLAWFMYMYRDLSETTSIWGVIQPTLIRGFGLGLLIAPVSAAAINAVPTSKAGMASSMMNLIQQVGGSVGIAFLSMVLSHRTHFHMSIIAAAANPHAPATADAIHNVYTHAHNLGYPHGLSAQIARIFVAREFASQGSVLAFQDSFLVGMVIVLAALGAAYFLPKENAGHASAEHSVME